MILALTHPYWGKGFLGFFSAFAKRCLATSFFTAANTTLYSDEIHIIALLLTSISCALIGTFLVLRKMTMLANALSHTVLLGIVVAVYLLLSAQQTALLFSETGFAVLLLASFASALLTATLIELSKKFLKVDGDAGLAFVFTTLFAIGILLATLLTRHTHLGTEAILGSLDAMHPDDLKISLWVLLANLLLVSAFYKEYTLSTFDPDYAYTVGISPTLFYYVMISQASLSIVAAFRVVGLVLVLALIVGPVQIVLPWIKNLSALLYLSALVGASISLLSVALSRHLLSIYQLPSSTSGAAAMLIGCGFLISHLLKALVTRKKQGQRHPFLPTDRWEAVL